MPKLTMAVNPPTLAKPVGYSHGFEVQGGKTLYMAGQVATTPTRWPPGVTEVLAYGTAVVIEARAGGSNEALCFVGALGSRAS